MLEAVTFDFWNTVMWEEPGSLRQRRLEVLPELLGRDRIDEVALEKAHDAAHRAYEQAWLAGSQFTVEHAAALISERLPSLSGGAPAVLVEGFCEAGRRAAVHPSDGIRDCLEELKAGGARLGIVCDIGLTPAYVVRELLARYGLLELFDDTAFSDEVGHYKPDRRIFEHALAKLGGAAPDRSAHVGDRRRTDVAGAQAIGMTAVRYRRVYDDAGPGPEAEHVVDDLAEIPALLGAGARA
ncbi:MAG TPA: HAD family hydrolase [Thermoleophilaceae bacterium]|nr:HAD family hydrolase [Thermoleophilaceae bacterium]